MSDDETPTTANAETASPGSAAAAGSAKKTTKRTGTARSGVSAAERAKAAQIRAAARGSAARTSETKRTAASTAAARTAAARAAAEKAEAAKAEAKAREAEDAAAKVAAVKASSPAPAPTGRRSPTAKKKADAAPVSEAVADAGSAATAEKPAASGKPATTKKPATAKKTTKTTAAKKSTTVRKTAAAAPVRAETAPDAASAPDQPAPVRKTSSASKGTTGRTTPAKKTAPARKAPAKASPARKSPASRAAAAADLAEVGAPARPTESAVAEDVAGMTHAASQDPSSAPSGSDAENVAASARETVVPEPEPEPEAEGQAAEPAAPEEAAHPETAGAVAQDESPATDEDTAATATDGAPEDGEAAADADGAGTAAEGPTTDDDGAETGGEDAPAVVVSSLPDPDDGSEHALVIRDLVKSFGDSRAVDGISLTVPSGSFYGIVGPNGAGKTTTLSIVAGLLSGDSGTVRVCGVDRAEDPRGAKKLMGVLPDRLRTFDRLTGRQLLHYYGLLRGLSADVVEARTVDLARAFDLTGALSRVVSDYSAGMTKKIMLAGAMIHSPRVLVLDEPFESVDPVSSGVILDILRAYVAHGGTVILSSHGMDLVEQVCSRIAIIVGGEVLAEGTVDEVRAGQTLEQRFVELSGGIAEVEGLEWLHTFSD